MHDDENMSRPQSPTVWVVVAALWLAVVIGGNAACPKPVPNTTPGLMDCASDQFKRDWPKLVAPVGTCLSSREFLSCLDGLDELVETTVDIVACVVSDTGTKAGMQAGANATDTLSRDQAERAQEWLRLRGYR